MTQAILRTCHGGLDPPTLRGEVFARLQRAVPSAAVWFASVDPATLLPTGSLRLGLPEETAPLFRRNEDLEDDVNKFSQLAQARCGVRSLERATDGDLRRSRRYRELMRPLALGDELRVALRVGGACWGLMCLHREVDATSYTGKEIAYLSGLAPHLAEGLRAGLLVADGELPTLANAPGLVLLAADLSVAGATEAGREWLEEICEPQAPPPPEAVVSVALRLRAIEAGATELLPRLRLRTRAGRWATMHASRLPQSRSGGVIAVIIEEARAPEVAELIVDAYGMTERERAVTALVCRGYSTREIAGRLFISNHTVQDHLKSIFDKVGVRSRRDLVAALVTRHHFPRREGRSGRRPDGFFR